MVREWVVAPRELAHELGHELAHKLVHEPDWKAQQPQHRPFKLESTPWR